MKRMYLSEKIIKTLITLTLFFGSLFMCRINAYAMEADAMTTLRAITGAEGSNLLVVSKDKSGTYEAITDAVSDAKDGDMIVIFPGEYNESLDIRDKDIILLGLDKNTCIIKYDTSVYSTPVLNGAAGLFCNLTFYGYRPKNAISVKDTSENTITPDNLDDYFSGYVIHIDDNYEYGHSIIFNNCNIISENNNCIGMGMRDHFSASFINCYIRSVGVAGILYVHDPDSLEYAGTDMHLIFKDNIWENYGYPYVIFAKSINYMNSINLTFQRVTTYCYASPMDEIYVPGNAYSGTDLRLAVAGLAPTLTPVYVMDNAKYTECIKSLRNGCASGFPGIYYITDTGNGNASALPSVSAPYYIQNAFDHTGNGWAGSNSYHLTNDSFGNTLDEMNFVR